MNAYLLAQHLFDKREVVTARNIADIIPKGELYSSLYAYPEETLTEHIRSTGSGSVKGYTGDVFGDWFVLDLDDKDKRITEVASALYPLLDDLEFMEVKYHLFFSGNKGFHLYIHKHWLKYDPADENSWNEVCRAFAQEIVEQYEHLEQYVDFAVYDKLRLFRFPFSIHQKTGNGKFLLTYRSENSGNMKDCLKISRLEQTHIIKDIYQSPVYHEEVEPFLIVGKLEDKVIVPDKPRKSDDHVEFPYGCKICMHSILNETDLTGSRHQTGLRLMSWWATTHGYTKDYVQVLLQRWNERLANPLAQTELTNILKYYPGYTYTCKDSIKSKYCSSQCVEYKTRNMDDSSIFVGDDYINRYAVSLSESRENWIYPSSVYPSLSVSPWKPNHGQLIVVAGGSSSGKTTLIENLMYNLHVPTLFFSYDMAGLSVSEVMLKMTKTNLHDPDSISKFNNAMRNIVTIDDSTIAIEDFGRYYHTAISRTGIRPRIVIADYLQMIPAKGSGPTERAITITKTIKAFTKQNKVIFILLSQVPKDIAGNGNLPLGMDSPKDSGEITNLADQLWTIWRPNKGMGTSKEEAARLDDTLVVNVCKDKFGVPDWKAYLSWNGDYTVTPRRSS